MSVCLGRLGPEELVVRRTQDGPTLAQRLEKLGYRVSGAAGEPVSSAPPHFEDRDDLLTYNYQFPPAHRAPPWFNAKPDAGLRARFEAALADGFREDIKRVARQDGDRLIKLATGRRFRRPA